MPQLGPAFLHRPIAAPDFATLSAGVRWLRDGALAWAPARLRRRGWRPARNLYALSRDSKLSPLGAVEQSWAGESRLADALADKTLPAAVALDPSLVFETSLDLPASARGAVNQAVALRMEELSPIPPKEAAFAVGPVVLKGGRIDVSLAIVRLETLSAVKSLLESKNLAIIGARLSEHGQFAYVFDRDANAGQRNVKRWLVALLALWASLLLALGAFEMRQARMLSALDQQQSDLRQELKDLRAAGDYAERLQEFARASFTYSEAAGAIAGALESLPEGVVIESAAANNGEAAITGFTPHGAQTSGLVRSPSDYPGYDRFRLAAPIASAEETGAAP